MLSGFQVKVSVRFPERIPPKHIPVIVISNHRSFLDAPLLISALGQPVHFACHRYMGQMPGFREMVELLGCLPLAEPEIRLRKFFQEANQLLMSGQWVGIFPEGTQPMVKPTRPDETGEMNRSFAHLALRVDVPQLAVLPVAITAIEESIHQALPLRVLHYFDPTEPLFDQPGLHPAVIYHQVRVSIGCPYWLNCKHPEGLSTRAEILALNKHCLSEIKSMVGTDSDDSDKK
ncbi:MAG: lysophospholipid acyltransferase family protein [Cyanobacteria bacterium P01_H01_bin.15]